MDRDLNRTLLEAVRSVCLKKARASRFNLREAVADVVEKLDNGYWSKIRDQLAGDAVLGMMLRQLPKAVKADPTHPAQTAFGFAHAREPITITKDKTAVQSRAVNHGEYRETTLRLEKKLRGYMYPRRRKPDVEELKAEIQERKKFEPQFAKLSAGEPDLPVWKAKELDEKRGGRTSAARKERAKKGAAGRWKPQARPTKNQ